VRDFLLNVGGLNSGDLDSARKVVGGTSKGLGINMAQIRNVINVILGFFRDIAAGVWTGPIPLLDLIETQIKFRSIK
jgi:hypothetical protein